MCPPDRPVFWPGMVSYSPDAAGRYTLGSARLPVGLATLYRALPALLTATPSRGGVCACLTTSKVQNASRCRNYSYEVLTKGARNRGFKPNARAGRGRGTGRGAARGHVGMARAPAARASDGPRAFGVPSDPGRRVVPLGR